MAGKTGASGGKRVNAGRKPGGATERTREIADQESVSGELLPLQVMLRNMRYWFTEAERLDRELPALAEQATKVEDGADALLDAVKRTLKFRKESQSAAEGAAPFMHARLETMPVRQVEDDHVPLHERLAELTSRENIKASAGKVVPLKR